MGKVKKTKKQQPSKDTAATESVVSKEKKNIIKEEDQTKYDAPQSTMKASKVQDKKIKKETSNSNKGHLESDDLEASKDEKKAVKRKAADTKEDDNEEDEKNEQDSEDSDLDLEDEEDDDDDDRDLDTMNDEGDEKLAFDFEAFPMEEDDREGIVNMLTQIFLRANIDTIGLADTIIKQSPFGNVVGPAEDDSEEDSENVVYGVLSAVEVKSAQEGAPKYASDIVDFIMSKANKHAVKSVLDHVKEILKTRIGMLINERMLNFPTQIVAPAFSSLSFDLAGMKKPYKNILYVYKIRVADEEAASTTSAPPKKNKNGPPMEKKKKMGKAEKKRIAAAALENADVIHDNPEDAELLKLTEGVAYHFDYPVHQDVEVGSKFHILRKNDKSYKPFRRVVLMDSIRFNAFVKKLSSIKLEE